MDIVVTLFQGAAVAVFGGAMIFAAISDLRSFEVPNWVSGVVVAAFLVIASTSAGAWPALMGNVITGLAVLAVGFALLALMAPMARRYWTPRAGSNQARSIPLPYPPPWRARSRVEAGRPA